MKQAKMVTWGVAAVLMIMSGCRGKPNWGAKKTLVKSRFMLVGGELVEHFQTYGQYPNALVDLGIAAGERVDPFTGQPFLYVAVTDSVGKRYACLIASGGGDREFQVSPADYRKTDVGRLPRNWRRPVPVYEETDSNVNAGAGDMCLQLVRDTHCTNGMGIRLGALDPGEIQQEGTFPGTAADASGYSH